MSVKEEDVMSVGEEVEEEGFWEQWTMKILFEGWSLDPD